MISLLCVLLAYLLGSVSFAVVCSRLMGLPDPRRYGSGNPGATNVLRGGNRLAALLTLLGDSAKGAVALLLIRALPLSAGVGEGTVALAAVAAFLGHLFPVFFGFRGGKGVATALGLLLALSPLLGLITAALWLLMLAATRYVSAASMAAALAAACSAPALLRERPLAGAVVLIAALVVLRHRDNVRRLVAGQESRFSLRRRPPPPPPG